VLRILWNSKSAMMAQQEKLDSISNNIANSSTEGYKRTDVSFKDLMQESLKKEGYPTAKNNGNSIEPLTGTGVRASEWTRDDKQGSLIETGLSTDLALDGEGYLKVTLPNGNSGYTRNGSFSLDSDGSLNDKNGNRLEILSNGTQVKLHSSNFKIDEAGNVFDKSSGTDVNIGKIKLYSFIGGDAMTSIGNSLYVPKNGVNSYEPGNTSIRQGFVEASNVDIAKEMTDMIITQRAFELSSKGLKTADDMWGMANNLRSK
jgi:flagellar basal-body rod protein FlgG